MVRMVTGISGLILISAAVVMGMQQTAAPTEQQRPAQQTPAQPAERPATPPAAAKADAMTFVGCLKPAATAGTYTLTEAIEAPKAEAGGAAAGEARPQATTGQKKTYALSGTTVKSEDLSKHVNHKIEVVGNVSRAAATPAAPSPGAPAAQPTPDTLTIQSFKMVSATCP